MAKTHAIPPSVVALRDANASTKNVVEAPPLLPDLARGASVKSGDLREDASKRADVAASDIVWFEEEDCLSYEAFNSESRLKPDEYVRLIIGPDKKVMAATRDFDRQRFWDAFAIGMRKRGHEIKPVEFTIAYGIAGFKHIRQSQSTS